MKGNNIKQLIDYWIKASEKDIQTAEDIFEKTKNYVTVLFYLHLSIEKAIKAYYVFVKSKHAPFSHNLIFLAKEAGLEINDVYKILLTEINEFNIECRYPDDRFSIYKKAAKAFTGKYLKKGKIFREWIYGKLKSE